MTQLSFEYSVGRTLHDELTTLSKHGHILQEVGYHITDNLNPNFQLRHYQIEAFARFFYWWDSSLKVQPTQLLFQMATGCGKTLIMAGLILDLYAKGYSNFIFFVNNTNIINKTRENFLNPHSIKYLFAPEIFVGDKQLRIREVGNFQAVNTDDINIVFSTIQGLHFRLNAPKENSVTYEDFENGKTVLISDEAHHINVETKSKGKTDQDILSWESTANRIFKSNEENVLLEFTATADMEHPEIFNKYHDKLIFDYPLKEFRLDGYSKEVKVLETDLSDEDRALQAIVLSQYRKKVFEKYKKIVKPVILYKSKNIASSKNFEKVFAEQIKNLDAGRLDKIKKSTNNGVLKKAFQYFESHSISLDNLAIEFKEDFNESKCISVNSKEDSEEKQLAVNTLEDEKNQFRAIFAVDKLNEGWDVLNLFDIVRLYNTRDSKKGKPGKTTISEAQLIGRGARYFPFQITESQAIYQRKYDDDIENELRIGEELYYHSQYNPRYIQELHAALVDIGIKPPTTIEKKLKLKESFKESSIWESGLIFLNEKKKYDRKDVIGLPEDIRNKHYKCKLKTGYTKESIIFGQNPQLDSTTEVKEFTLVNFGKHVIRKAINRLDFFRFSNLKSYFPHLTSITDFIQSYDYLNAVKVEVEGGLSQLENLSRENKLQIAVYVLGNISQELPNHFVEFRGTRVFKPTGLSNIFKDKVIEVSINEGGDQQRGIGMTETVDPEFHLDLSKKNWYAFNDNYGTSEEKYFIKFINQFYDRIKKDYEDVYLLRNQNFFQIFNFEDGRTLEPDFVLFLRDKEMPKAVIYQIFIEPKGKHLIIEDKWKEEFLMEIEKEHKIEVIFENKEFRVLGLPFYNENLTKKKFTDKLRDVLKIG